jgi:Tol biopolymer transport system component
MFLQANDRKQNTSQIYFLSYPDAQRQRFTNDLSLYSQCCVGVTSDNKELVAVQINQLSDLYLLPGGDAGKVRQLTSGEPVFVIGVSPDKLLAFNTRGQMLSLNLDGSNSTVISPGFDRVFAASLCPDGKQVAFVGMKDTVGLWRVNLDGSNLKKIAEDLANNPGCSPDSKTVYYSNSSGTKLFAVPIDGGEPVEAKDLPPAGFVFFSSDGKYAAYLHGSPQEQFRTKCGIIDVAAKKVVGDFDVPLGADSPQFSPDGKSIQFLLTRNGARNVWAQPIQGGNLKQVTMFPSGDAGSFRWSPDGKQLYMSRGISKRDVVLITHFR